MQAPSELLAPLAPIQDRLKVTHAPISSLRPDPRNPRIHTKKHVQQIAKSIESFGFNVPLLIDAEGRVIGGHGRLQAAQFLGWSEVPVISLKHMSEAQIRGFAVADNRLCEVSTWDDRLLAEQLQHLSSLNLDFDLTAVGFELPEIDLRIQALDLSSDESAEILEPITSSGPVISQLEDLWLLGLHRLYCGSALVPESYAALMQGEQAHLVFSDAPYNCSINGHVLSKGNTRHGEFTQASGEMSSEQFAAFLQQSIGQMASVCADGAILFLCMDWRGLQTLTAAALSQGLELKNLAVWNKGVGTMGSFYRSQHELILVLKKGIARHTNNVQLGRFGRNRTNVWNYPGMSTGRVTEEGNLMDLHPTVKPVALVADALLDASERGQIVLDSFMGSGTTIIAAEKTGRVAYGIELDPKYVDTAIQRWQRKTGQQAVHAVTGETFDSRLASAMSPEEGA
jgi:DNA modification methylase